MIESLLDRALQLLLLAGLPALFVLFVLKGALVGKPLPTTIFLPGYVIAISASQLETVGIVLMTAFGYLCGQLVVYTGSRRKGVSFIESAPRVRLPEAKVRRVEGLFESHGGAAIFLTSFVPYLRGFILIPAGMASYPVGRVILYVYTATLIYHGAIVVLAIRAVRIII